MPTRAGLLRYLILFLLCVFVNGGAEAAMTPRQKVAANRLAEWTFTAQKPCADPFNTLTLDAVFTTPSGHKLRVPAFWAGGSRWKVRYASPEKGDHHFVTECSDTQDAGLHGVTRSVTIEANHAETNPLYRHGPVRVAADKRRFEHQDGTPFLWLGDTWWMGLSSRLHWPDEFASLAADRKQKGFNVVQIVAGLYPELPPLDPHCANEGGMPWESEYRSIRPEYWDMADRRMLKLVESGFAPCVVGAWGYYMPYMGAAKLQQHWRYIIARWGALPCIWCLAGEVNLPYYHNPKFPFDDVEQAKAWMPVVQYVRAHDPYRRPLTVHPTGLGNLTARGTADANLLDYDMLQTGHGGDADLPITVRTALSSYHAAPTLPVVQGEVNYEALLGLNYNPPAIQRLMYWGCMLSGCSGYTYGGNGIWQVNREGEPRITYGNYPVPSWDKAMHLPGSTQLAASHRLLASLPWHKMAPHPEWVTSQVQPPPNLSAASWIWYPEGSPATDAPVARRWFRRVVDLPPSGAPVSARLAITADDAYHVWINGNDLGSGGSWKTARIIDGIEKHLNPGKNVIAVLGENSAAPVTANPAGLLALLELRYADGRVETIKSDSEWRAENSEHAGWQNAGFDDSAWPHALKAAAYGAGPWGTITTAGRQISPMCAGIPGQFRLIYLPSAQQLTVTDLETGIAYTAEWIEPTTCKKRHIGRVDVAVNGSWKVPMPPRGSEDWLLLLTAIKE